jgi:hypothetical protein
MGFSPTFIRFALAEYADEHDVEQTPADAADGSGNRAGKATVDPREPHTGLGRSPNGSVHDELE